MKRVVIITVILGVLVLLTPSVTGALHSPIEPQPWTVPPTSSVPEAGTATPAPECPPAGWTRLEDWMGRDPLWTDGTRYCIEGAQ